MRFLFNLLEGLNAVFVVFFGGGVKKPVNTEQEFSKAGTAGLCVEYTCNIAEWYIRVCKSLDKGQNAEQPPQLINRNCFTIELTVLIHHFTTNTFWFPHTLIISVSETKQYSVCTQNMSLGRPSILNNSMYAMCTNASHLHVDNMLNLKKLATNSNSFLQDLIYSCETLITTHICSKCLKTVTLFVQQVSPKTYIGYIYCILSFQLF